MATAKSAQPATPEEERAALLGDEPQVDTSAELQSRIAALEAELAQVRAAAAPAATAAASPPPPTRFLEQIDKPPYYTSFPAPDGNVSTEQNIHYRMLAYQEAAQKGLSPRGGLAGVRRSGWSVVGGVKHAVYEVVLHK